ncbi:ATP-binding protein [Flavobacterium sp. SLB02]|uniref:ATP-binding protein n=1 Tax=Flavobacterium sp. SLB02 TaxID=2665645 RepID=UPI0012AA3980|nr:ATP-binding protein [Flavobacterium sp. SLB02]QGK73824.1 ATP-binding protein [Flavobacterium sp. SLB02]
MKKISFMLFIGLIPVIVFSQKITKVWESDSLFLKPESALYDPSRKIIYISNINGEYLAKDGNGFISKIKTNGEIELLKWVDGLDNPQGMGLYKNKLYVADINRVVQINTSTAKIEKIYKVDSAKFFNDITSDTNGDIYISDCFDNKIYKMSNGKIKVWLESDFLSKPNGLLCTKDDVLVLNMKNQTAFAINKLTKKSREFFNGIDNLDGIVSDGANGYIVSGAWQGQLFHIDWQGNKKLIIDLGKEQIITADIEYIVNENLLIVPTLNKTVIGYKLMKFSIEKNK